MHILVFWAAALALAPLVLGIGLQALSLSRDSRGAQAPDSPSPPRNHPTAPASFATVGSEA